MGRVARARKAARREDLAALRRIAKKRALLPDEQARYDLLRDMERRRKI